MVVLITFDSEVGLRTSKVLCTMRHVHVLLVERRGQTASC